MLRMIFPKSALVSLQCLTNMGWSLLVEEAACRSFTLEIFSCKTSWEKIPIKLVRHPYVSWSLQMWLYMHFYDIELLASDTVLVMLFRAFEITMFSCMRRQE